MTVEYAQYSSICAAHQLAWLDAHLRLMHVGTMYRHGSQSHSQATPVSLALTLQSRISHQRGQTYACKLYPA